MRSGRARHERALRAIRQQQAGLHKSRAERGNRCRLGLDADFGKGCLRPAAGHGRKCRKEPCDLFFSWTRLVGFVHID
jgi:hypothetical protein